MLNTKHIKKNKSRKVIVVDTADTETSYEYTFGEKAPEDVTETEYVVACKREAKLLVQDKKDKS